MQLLKSEYYELPKSYDQTIIRLLVQSPTRMFVYWEVSQDTIRNFNSKFHNYDDCVVVLKVTNLTHNYSYQIPVNPFANNYYIEVEDSGCNYQVELGRISKKGFVNLYTSNVAMVPSSLPVQAGYDSDGILFANYLCIGSKSKIKIFGSKEHYNRFQNQNHTAFDGQKLAGSSEEFLGSSGNSSAFNWQ